MREGLLKSEEGVGHLENLGFRPLVLYSEGGLLAVVEGG